MHHRHWRESRCVQRRAGQCRHLTCDAVDAERMRQVGRQLQREQRVVQRQGVAHIGAQQRVGGQFQQAAVVIAELQLFRRTQHALALDPAQLAQLDRKRCAALLGRRQFGTDQRQRHPDAHARIRRAADDLQQAVFRVHTRIDPAHPQSVGIGMLFGLDDLGHHHARKRRRHRLGRFDLQPGHGQQVCECCGIERRVAERAQPGFRKLHGRGRSILDKRPRGLAAG